MTGRFVFYLLIIIAGLMQVVPLDMGWARPDLLLIMVVFAGIFLTIENAVLAGITAALVRGLFYAGTVPADILAFPLAGIMSHLLSGMFYRGNLIIQFCITAIAYVVVLLIQYLYLDLYIQSGTGPGILLADSAPHCLLTAAVAPFVFFLLKGFRAKEI